MKEEEAYLEELKKKEEECKSKAEEECVSQLSTEQLDQLKADPKPLAEKKVE